MLIAETFSSIQGEGTLIGMPSYFIRVAGCNLRCAWCDTRHASWEAQGEEIDMGLLVEQAIASGIQHIVLTGGEPMLAKETPALIQQLRDRQLHVTVETNGTLPPPCCVDLASISPKLKSSVPDPKEFPAEAAKQDATRFDPEIINQWIKQSVDYQLKFVLQGKNELPELQEVLSHLNYTHEHVLIMPEGKTRDELRNRAEELIALCIKHGYRYAPRLHIELFGNRRRV